MAITGRAGSTVDPIAEPYVSLQQIDSRTLAATTLGQTVTPQKVNLYLYPNTLTGIIVMLFVTIVLIIGFLLLMSV